MAFSKVMFVPSARADLRSAARYIALQGNREAGLKFGDNLIERALTLESFPERGRIVPEFKDPSIREIFFKSYRIIYRVKDGLIEVLRFWHAARGTPEIDSDEFPRN